MTLEYYVTDNAYIFIFFGNYFNVMLSPLPYHVYRPLNFVSIQFVIAKMYLYHPLALVILI